MYHYGKPYNLSPFLKISTLSGWLNIKPLSSVTEDKLLKFHYPCYGRGLWYEVRIAKLDPDPDPRLTPAIEKY